MEKDIETVNEKGMGVKLSDEKRNCICNLRFADDVLMIVPSLKQLQRMIADFKRSREAQGLEIHPDRNETSHQSENKQIERIEMDGMYVEKPLPEGTVKYLGQLSAFVDQETTEVQHRIGCVQSAFARHLLRHMLHFFDAVITPTITNGAGTWTTTKKHEKCSAQTNAECFVSSLRQREDTKQKAERDLAGKDSE